MSIADDLEKLVALRAAGDLTEEEFAQAKLRLFQGIQPGLSTRSRMEGEDRFNTGPMPDEQIFRSSRWSSGNTFFPDAIIVVVDGILFRKRGLFGSNEEHINYRAVASCRVKNCVLLANITIETTGGSQPINVNGLWKSDARAIMEIIRCRQGV
jgi:hypothetical protein